MSDLRAANGGARTTGGPIPVSQPDRAHIRTPQMIMNARRQRAEAEEQRKADEERRRESTERAAQNTERAAQNTERAAQNTAPAASQARPRAATTATATAAADASSRRPPHTQHARRPSAAATSPAQPGLSAGASSRSGLPTSSTTQPRESTTSNFPHAFERWETLSSHWEGLTSYWIRRLEQSTDEVRREPLAQQMSRQITDLSAAGANLFHAVVELQRLRASSERKFQRWFYEHRQEQERAQEREAQLSAQITLEREARLEADANMERLATEKKNAERAVVEMKRELQISKEEARRAWEELGRREQEERDRTFSLREGQPTLVGGVQVVPMTQNIGDPGRGHGDDAYVESVSPGIEQHYSYEEGQSPTDTDPFTEPSRHAHRETTLPSHVALGTYVPSGAAPHPSSRTAASHEEAEETQVPAPQQYPYYTSSQSQPAPTQPATSLPETFYQQPASYLHQDLDHAQENERTYAASQGEPISEADDEFATDEQGRRVPYRSLQSPISDEYDVQDDRRRELEHLQHYGTAATTQPGFSASSTAPSTDAAAAPQPSDSSHPDYSGDGYGDEWIGMRHHHPTRLSDVPEEDERSRTSPSRASQASRGRLF